ncbi:molybdate metabolism regulator, partial [Brachyspira hampsonii 30599]
RYEHFVKILLYGNDKEGEGGTRYVILDYIVNKDFEKSLRYMAYGYEKRHKENVRTLNGEELIYTVFEDFNKYFSKEFEEYTDKYIDIINNNDNKKILHKMGRDAVIPLIAICSVIKNNKECDEKYINAAIKSFDIFPNLYDTLNVIAALLDKNEAIKNKFIEVLNNNEEYIIDINIEIGQYLRLLDYSNPYKAKDKFLKAINYPNSFIFIAKHFEDYFRYEFIYGARDLYLNYREDFYKVYNLVGNDLKNDRNKRIFIVLSGVLLENNDNKIDTNNLKKSIPVFQTIVNKFTE